MQAFIIGVVVAFFYYIPTIVAYQNKKVNKQAIMVLNTFLGWTVFGWVMALVWAVKKD